MDDHGIDHGSFHRCPTLLDTYSMKLEPHPYQIKGAQVLLGSRAGAGLLLDPGLGKTLTTLMAFLTIKEQNPDAKMLVVAPIRPMYGTWPAEIMKWEEFQHLTIAILHGYKKDYYVGDHTADIYVINPEGILWLFEKKSKRQRPPFTVLCVDESTKFKNTGSRRFRCLKKHLHEFERRWILTGTVCPNGLLDLFGQAFIMDRGESLGKYVTYYKNRYFYAVDKFGYQLEPYEWAAEEISRKLADNVLQLDAEDYLDMPEFMVLDRFIDLPAKVMESYRELEKEFYLAIEEDAVIGTNTAVMGNKLRQIANGFVYTEEGVPVPMHEEKMKALEEIIEETNGHPLLILYEYKEDQRLIMDMLGDSAECITGKSGKTLESICERFNRGALPYLLMNSASSHGMNIQGACHHMVWFGLTWNLENYIQANYRLYRQGQDSDRVFCYRIIARDTKETAVAKVLNDKEITQDQVNEYISGNRRAAEDTDQRATVGL